MVEESGLKEMEREREWIVDGWMDCYEDERMGLVEEMKGW